MLGIALIYMQDLLLGPVKSMNPPLHPLKVPLDGIPSLQLVHSSIELRELLGVLSIPLSVFVTKLLNSTNVDTGSWGCHTSFTISNVRITGKDSFSFPTPQKAQQTLSNLSHLMPTVPLGPLSFHLLKAGDWFFIKPGSYRALLLLPSPGQRGPHTFFTIPGNRGTSPKNTQPGWLCLLPHTPGHGEALQWHRQVATHRSVGAPSKTCFAQVNMHVFRLSEEF